MMELGFFSNHICAGLIGWEFPCTAHSTITSRKQVTVFQSEPNRLLTCYEMASPAIASIGVIGKYVGYNPWCHVRWVRLLICLEQSSPYLLVSSP